MAERKNSQAWAETGSSISRTAGPGSPRPPGPCPRSIFRLKVMESTVPSTWTCPPSRLSSCRCIPVPRITRVPRVVCSTIMLSSKLSTSVTPVMVSRLRPSRVSLWGFSRAFSSYPYAIGVQSPFCSCFHPMRSLDKIELTMDRISIIMETETASPQGTVDSLFCHCETSPQTGRGNPLSL